MVLCALGGYGLLLPFGWMYASSARYRTSAAKVPATAVGIVFGAGAPEGQPSSMLLGRLRLGLDLYRSGKVQVLLVTGDNSSSHSCESISFRVCHTSFALRLRRSDFSLSS